MVCTFRYTTQAQTMSPTALERNVRNGWKGDTSRATNAAMRFALIVPALIGCAACAEHQPVSVRAIGEGYACTVTLNGALMETDADLQAARTTDRRALVETDRKTPYRCLGTTVIRLQQAGFKVVGITADGVPIPSR